MARRLGPHRAHRPGRRARSGVSEIIAVILLGAITVVLAAVLYILVIGLTQAPGGQAIGTSLAVGTFSEASSGSGAGELWYYNATVQSGGTLTWGDLLFQVQAADGSPVPAGPIGVSATNGASSCYVASYAFATGAWSPPGSNPCSGVTTGPSGLVAPGSELQLTSSTSLQDQGRALVAIGQGPYTGTVHLPIP